MKMLRAALCMALALSGCSTAHHSGADNMPPAEITPAQLRAAQSVHIPGTISGPIADVPHHLPVPDDVQEQLRNLCHYTQEDDEGPAQKCYARSIDDYQREQDAKSKCHIYTYGSDLYSGCMQKARVQAGASSSDALMPSA